MARNKYPEETVRLILDVAERLFIEKGYEKTSIQDIINGLGGLSKGAIYHHFKSKEEIFDAVAERYNSPTLDALQKVRDREDLTGYQKLRKMFEVSVSSGEQDFVYSIAPNMLDNPKLLAMEVRDIFKFTAPQYIRPVIEQGIADGTIKTDYPQELAEVILLLTNIWLNPLVMAADARGMARRVELFNDILKGMGIDLLDVEMLEAFNRYCELANHGGTENVPDENK